MQEGSHRFDPGLLRAYMGMNFEYICFDGCPWYAPLTWSSSVVPALAGQLSLVTYPPKLANSLRTLHFQSPTKTPKMFGIYQNSSAWYYRRLFTFDAILRGEAIAFALLFSSGVGVSFACLNDVGSQKRRGVVNGGQIGPTKSSLSYKQFIQRCRRFAGRWTRHDSRSRSPSKSWALHAYWFPETLHRKMYFNIPTSRGRKYKS